jgi:hypothetical protein
MNAPINAKIKVKTAQKEIKASIKILNSVGNKK